MNKRKSIITTAVSLLIIIGFFFTYSIKTEAATDPSMAPADWAFTENSIPLHDAILTANYAIDTDSDGYISISEATSKTGSISIQNLTGGTLEGIGYFTNITNLTINGSNFSSIPEEIGNLTSLNTLVITSNTLTGSIPETIGNLTNLQILMINDTPLTGSIPETIGNLSNLTDLQISFSQLTGTIPNSIGNLINLKALRINDNPLTGSIPETIGNLSNLTNLQLSSNQLTGTIPDSFGTLTNLQTLMLARNQLTGSIPASIGALPTLWYFTILDNQISGEIPTSFYESTSLSTFIVSTNSELQGNPAEGFADSTTLNYLAIEGTNLIQARPNIPTLQEGVGTFSYDNLAANLLLPDKTDIIEGLIQADIDRAQESCDWISDPVEKQQWQDNIDLAQNFLDAKQAVENLFTDTTHTDIPDDLTMDDILDSEDIVTTLPDGTVKTALLNEIEKAKNMLSVKEEVNNLFTDDTHTAIPDDLTLADIEDVESLLPTIPDGTLKNELQVEIDKAKSMLKAKEAVDDLYKDDTTIRDDLIQEDIDDAQDIVDTLDDGPFKDELQARIDEAQRQLDARDDILLPVEVPNNYTTSTQGTIVTSDTMNSTPYLGLCVVAFSIILMIKRRTIN